MLSFQLISLSIAALLSVFFGIRYMLAREFMPYHAVVAGTSWPQLTTGLQTIILGMLKIVGGGLVTYGIALLCLLVPLNRHEAWASWAALAITVTTVVPTLYVTIMLRRFEPAARTPVAAASIVLALATLGAAASLFI